MQSLAGLWDPFATNFVAGAEEHPEFEVPDTHWLGDIQLKVRTAGGAWQSFSTGSPQQKRKIFADHREVMVNYGALRGEDEGAPSPVSLRESYAVEHGALNWTFTLHNASAAPVEIGSLGLPLLFNTMYAKEPAVTYSKRVIRHSYIEGDDSFIFLTRANGEGPFGLMTPKSGTHLEYDNVARKHPGQAPSVFAPRDAWEGLYTAFVLAKAEVTPAEEQQWRQPLTSRTLAPAEDATYGFTFELVASYAEAKQALVRRGLLGIDVSPGMVLPTDLEGLLSIRSRVGIRSISAEFPDQTHIEKLPRERFQQQRYRLTFAHLGENRLFHHLRSRPHDPVGVLRHTASLGAAAKSVRPFWSPTSRCVNPSKWYDGLFSLWDMQGKVLRTPDDPGGIQPYMVSGSDDPDLSKAPYLAQKNLGVTPTGTRLPQWSTTFSTSSGESCSERTRSNQIPMASMVRPTGSRTATALSVLIPAVTVESTCGVLSTTPTSYSCTSPCTRSLAHTRMRCIMLRLRSTCVVPTARRLPTSRFPTASAWKSLGPSTDTPTWAVKQGAFHEVYILDLLKALDEEGQTQKASTLRNLWNQKVLYFLYDHPYPFGSEMYFDTTAFESTHAIASYALKEGQQLEATPWHDKNTGLTYQHHGVSRAKTLLFMRKEILANVAARGYLETSYYQLGSDIRQGGNTSYLLSYMTQMGGWSLLDDGLGARAGFADDLSLGYASYLAGWADINAGSGCVELWCLLPRRSK